MGVFSVEIEIGDPRGERFEHIEALVDSGASPEGSQALLGAITLESLGLAIGPVRRRLVPVPGLLMESRLGLDQD